MATAINCNEFAHVLKAGSGGNPYHDKATGRFTGPDGGGGGGFDAAFASSDARHFAAHPSQAPNKAPVTKPANSAAWAAHWKANPNGFNFKKTVPPPPPPARDRSGLPRMSAQPEMQMVFGGTIGRMNAQRNLPRRTLGALDKFKPMEPGGDLHAKPRSAPFPIKNLVGTDTKTHRPRGPKVEESVNRMMSMGMPEAEARHKAKVHFGMSDPHTQTQADMDEASRAGHEASAEVSGENNWQHGAHDRPFYMQRARFDRDLTNTRPSTPRSPTPEDDSGSGGHNSRAEEFAENADLNADVPESSLALGSTPTEQHLGKSQLASIKSIGGGISETHMVHFHDGSKGIWKPEDGESGGARSLVEDGSPVEREVAAYKIAQLAGMGDIVAPTVERTIDGRRGSMAAYVPGDDAKHFDEFDKFDGKTDAARAAVFDYVIGNQDRHGGNWRYDPDGQNSTGGFGKITMIDHNLTFPDAHDYSSGSSNEANTAIFNHGQSTGHAPSKFAEGFVNNKDKILAMLKDNGISSHAVEGVGLRIDRLAKASSFRELDDEDWDHTAESSASSSASQPGWASPSGNHTVGGGLRGQALLDALANGDPTHPQQQESRFGNKNPNGGPPADNREKPGQLTWDNMNTSNWHAAGMPTRPLHDARFPTPAKPAAKPAGALTAWEAMTHGAWVGMGRPPRPKNPKGTVGHQATPAAPSPKPASPANTMEAARFEFDASYARRRAAGAGVDTAMANAEFGTDGKNGRGRALQRAQRMRKERADAPKPKSRPTLDYADEAFGHSLERHQAANPGRSFSKNIASARAANGGVMTRGAIMRARAAGLGLRGRDLAAREALAHIAGKHSTTFKPS